ncbi:ent-kaurenoic acid oxidase 1-like [Mangifera indica]|uniref:ent-kaurenoic acid oxidase 1-like n=1 Tax=Mangifera indica TaxID=29780 RepID=UPI001CFB144C|nr:ent-kaurenoic acid oxidase 1-like [Mangifera indica]
MDVWLSWVLGFLPILGWLLWWWNDLWYAAPLIFRYSGTGTRLPPGHMGFPVFGEIISFLWYFKVLRRPDDFINSKRRKYGDGVGMYRTYLFGSPAIIACFPSINKFVFRSSDKFIQKWPSVELMGYTSLVAVHGKAHARVRSFVISAINRPGALRRITEMVQPRMVAALQSWAQKGQLKVYNEVKKVKSSKLIN